jgi:ATP-binding cassette, subfamily A (ABC1), member 3
MQMQVNALNYLVELDMSFRYDKEFIFYTGSVCHIHFFFVSLFSHSLFGSILPFVYMQYNFTALHVAPMFQALADEAIIRQATNNEQFQIKVTIAPLPITNFEEGLGQADDALLLFLLVVLSFPIISGTFGAFIVTERESKAKHLQTVAGVEPFAYWLSSFMWDFINYQIPMWITIGLFFIFDMEAFTTSEKDQFSAIVATLLLYGSASTSFSYVLTFAFKSPSMITTISIISGFLIGLGGPLAAFIMTLIGLDPLNPNKNLIDIADLIVWILRITPPFCLGKSIFYILNLGSVEAIKGKELSAWSEPIALYEIYFLAGQTIVYWFLAVQLDKWSTNPSVVSMWKRFTCSWMCSNSKDGDIVYSSPDDSDVVNEAERVLSGGANSDLIVLSQLTKVYDNGKKAVNNVSLGIPPGQCFGLLGINGAGKTTTMGILTAEFPPSSGDATLAGYSVMREPQKTRRRIGYCPQFDAHFANMTGREHVELYASIKGVPVAAVKEAASDKLKEVGLSDFDSDRLCSNYSGGMKRRLSLAIATIGSPQIVFLDECSTGVDPVARREIWELVSAMVSDQNVAPEERTSVILTTHSMEECEALCPRIGIMANGKLRCLGSAQHLKTKFGQGYQLELKTALASADDHDYVEVVGTLLRSKGLPETSSTDDVTFKLSEAKAALRLVTNDDYLADMVSSEDPLGYNVWRDANSLIGVTLDALAAFATNEIRMRSVESFLSDQFNGHVLRERQDTKARYEVSSQGTRISDIFGRVEDNKVRLWLDDYGVSQTSLEQVFNMHAAEAEKLKQGRNDN